MQAILGMFNPAKLGGRRNLLRSIGIHLTCAEPRIVKLVQWAKPAEGACDLIQTVLAEVTQEKQVEVVS